MQPLTPAPSPLPAPGAPTGRSTLLSLPLDPDLHRALADLADATGCRTEDLVLDAVRERLRAEEARVRGTAERLAGAHADLLRRLGE
ncbi:hypothetical protein [Streptomyces sp. NBC_00582]|uniref:hypothetical protein n=1 Tax=Streptomyces sp. NBC_00582 TaxID=2975783 RepID=UPI0010F13C88|nr:hypothetical protein [Streptomyces sp. NBC_00582]WUB64252.1 hypothetical protein OG852_29615 [Streptomyces sp. NBC_00582]